MTSRSPSRFNPPSDSAKQPLSAEQTDAFYNAACEMESLKKELAGRTLLDFGLRIGEFTHLTQKWIVRIAHPKTGNISWAVDVPQYERCTSGAGPVGMGNPDGVDLHNTSNSCHTCRNRNYQSKDWITEEIHTEYPWHPKTRNSFSRKIWALPTQSCEETISLLNDFLAPDRQWPTTHNPVRRYLREIAENAGLERDVKPHALRHTYGCRLAAAGKSLDDRMNQLRHGDIEMAMWYSEVRGLRHRDRIRQSWDANEDF